MFKLYISNNYTYIPLFPSGVPNWHIKYLVTRILYTLFVLLPIVHNLDNAEKCADNYHDTPFLDQVHASIWSARVAFVINLRSMYRIHISFISNKPFQFVCV